MRISRMACMLAAAAGALAAQQLPALRTEPVNAGSVFYVKNVEARPLAAWLIELVNYPGSSYTLFQDDPAAPLAPGAEKKIPVTNMTVGAAPEYVKITAAVYADGSSAGEAAKVGVILARRKAILETTRELIARLEKAKAAGAAKAAVSDDLRKWVDSLPAEGKSRRLTAAGVSQAATLSTIAGVIARLGNGSIEEMLAELRTTETSLAVGKP